MEAARSFVLLGGQCAPLASDGKGIRALYQCPACQRAWLQDGKKSLLELRAPEIARLAREVAAADLAHLPALMCSRCLYKTGGGRVSVDEYAGGEGFGLCWEMPRPAVLHATSVLQSPRCASMTQLKADVLTRPDHLRAVLQAGKVARPPRDIQVLPAFICRLQAADQRPGLGQPGTEQWRWQGWCFELPCQPLGRAVVTFMLALPGDEALAPGQAFATWTVLLDLALSTL